VSQGPDPSLAHHLARINRYRQDSGLVAGGVDRTDVRRDLAAFMAERTPAVLDAWMRDIGPTFGIPEADWPGIMADQAAAIGRWARHIADPADCDTYVMLRRHTRSGFIARYPASRFLTSQMRFVQLLTDDLRQRFAAEPARVETLSRLLMQEFQARVLHITDFFVEAREEELRDQEESYRRNTDHAPACILLADAGHGRIFSANQVAERLLGWSADQLIGRMFSELHPARERARAEALWRRAIAEGHARSDELHLLRHDAEPLPAYVHAGYIEYGDRRWVQLICVDLSDRKALESQLVQSEKMAAIGQLAAGIAHELRNPLAIVMNAVYDLRQLLGTADPEVHEDLRIAEEEIVRAQATIKNLLEFSRESSAEAEHVDVNELLTRTLQLMQKYLQDNGVRVRTDLGAVPPCVANGNAMRQIALNLITNAVQAMPDGGELTLRTARAGSDRIRLEIHDTGVGIPPSRLNDIFNPFYTTKAPGQGTGLGLSVVHSIIERYRGEIRVASEVGIGTTFTIELPCPCHAEAVPGGAS
jgi:PAS domain S-box-containing protein